jgi:hypothetical protein
MAMLRPVFVMWVILVMTTQAHSGDFIRAHEREIPLPDGPYPPEYLMWEIIDDRPLLRKLVDKGDPLARSHAVGSIHDLLMVEGNLPTGHKTTVRTGLPQAVWRQLNYGVPKRGLQRGRQEPGRAQRL